MANKYYRIKVPTIDATNNFQFTADGSLVPKFNKKISFTVSSSDSNAITFTMTGIAEGRDVAYPDGDSIQWRGKDYKLKKMTIFKGLYNDYSGIVSGDKDKAEVMLTFENNNNNIDTVYVFFLLSVSSVTKSGFFNIFMDSNDGKVDPPTGTFTDKKVSILDIMPNGSKYIHVFDDTTRKMNNKYSIPDTGLQDKNDYSNSTVIIFSPSDNGYKNIPMKDELGYIFANSTELLNNIYEDSMNTIQLHNTSDTTIQCQASNNPCPYVGGGYQIGWKKDGNNIKDDGKQSDVYLLTSTNKYSRLNNPFELAHSIGGIGSVLTSCYEVEVDMSGNEINKGEKHIPAFSDKYMIPQEYWFGGGKGRLTKAEMEQAEEDAKKFWFEPGEPGFYILMVVGILIAVLIFIILFKEIQLKYLPPRIKAATGVEAAGPK